MHSFKLVMMIDEMSGRLMRGIESHKLPFRVFNRIPSPRHIICCTASIIARAEFQRRVRVYIHTNHDRLRRPRMPPGALGASWEQRVWSPRGVLKTARLDGALGASRYVSLTTWSYTYMYISILQIVYQTLRRCIINKTWPRRGDA